MPAHEIVTLLIKPIDFFNQYRSMTPDTTTIITMKQPSSLSPYSALTDCLTSTNLNRQSFNTLLVMYAILLIPTTLMPIYETNITTNQTAHFGAIFLIVQCVSEIIYQRFKHPLSSKLGLVSLVTGLVCLCLLIVLIAISLAQQWPNAQIHLYVIPAVYCCMLTHHYIARMRNLQAPLSLILAPLALLPIPYVLYLITCRDKLSN